MCNFIPKVSLERISEKIIGEFIMSLKEKKDEECKFLKKGAFIHMKGKKIFYLLVTM